MDQADRRSRLPIGGDGVKGQNVHGTSDTEFIRGPLANAVTAILLQAEAIRRHLANDTVQQAELESAAEQIQLNAERIWNVMEATILPPTGPRRS